MLGAFKTGLLFAFADRQVISYHGLKPNARRPEQLN